MNTPIPNARKLAEKIVAAVEGCTCFDCRDKAEEIIANALLVEREAADERAAKIALRNAPATQDGADVRLQDMARRIASAIRDRSKS